MAAQARHVDNWVTEGIISRDQAESICRYERRVTPSRVTTPEALAYAGTAVLAGIALALVADVWQHTSRMARLGTVGFIALGLLVVGLTAATDTMPTVRRIGETGLFLSVPAVALTVSVATGAGVGATTSILIASAAASVLAAALYTRWRSGPQHVALLLSTLSLALSLAMWPFEDVPDALPGIVFFAAGTGWVLAATRGWLIPRLTGEIAGALAALAGSTMLAVGFDSGLVAVLAVAVGVAVGTVAFGVTRSRVALTIAGIVALASYVPWLASEVLGPSIGTPFALVASAMAIALWATRRSKNP